MNLVNEGLGVFRCWRSGYSSNRHAASENTWFENLNSIDMVAKGILLTYAWTQNFTYNQAIRESTLINTGQITDDHTAVIRILIVDKYIIYSIHAYTSANTDT